MKLNIAICDDDTYHVESIKEFLCQLTKEHDTVIIEAYSGEELLDKAQNKSINIAFLDIDMAGMNGIEVGKEIRKMFPEAIIVFLTGYKHYALEAFNLESFQYIIKPITHSKFQSLVEKIMIRLKEKESYKEQSRYFIIKNQKDVIKLEHNKIYFFERQGKKVLVFSDQGSYEFRDTLKSVLISLDNALFVRCHHGFIVNTQKILKVQGDMIMFNDIDKNIPISRRYKPLILEHLQNNIFREK
ncbi:two component transcriptional regulator, LytTR family [Alkaliphilus metalliredigens QYMF]|uniref:Stage 0 sporulation protein A homolog n=1 Tax=Alkaliphilus metalliredigens (strain QYMF) TaxID=293826 RepID=A6TKX6_ALKMQ|nr:LytTR family DNA-binding domain-containing protein [Alkaliphilus metalliredigens]ABR46844.1 two component transcriptional regulator, LytTR family [Alkaliphilus metalliredigens QYMF]